MTLRKRTTQSKVDFMTSKSRALVLVLSRLKIYNEHYKFKYNKVIIKNQSTVWGSCSRNKNLNFNFRILRLEPDLVDYIVVHELCHLGELNHSHKFWDLVAQKIPDYKTKHAKLRKYNLTQ